MKAIFLIALNTNKEILRDRILYGLIVFAIFFIGVSVALGQLSYAEQARISLDFGLAGIQLSALMVAIFVGSTLVARELEKRTIFTLLPHAVSRWEFLLGKFFGMVIVLGIILLGLFCVVIGVTLVLKFDFNSAIAFALFGILLEAMVLLSATILFGVFTTPFMAVTFSISLFIIGHWLSDLMFFAKKSESPEFISFAKFITYVVPDLERFNWKYAASYAEVLDRSEVISAGFYGMFWMVIFLCMAMFIFRRRDFA
jgi:ABC-type transport system involved in multi-copper enzyme maturation permease subunit